MNLCDAHFHFNRKSSDPVQDMLTVIRSYHISAVVLILNQECDFQMFVKNQERLTNCGACIHPAILMDIHNPESFYKKSEWMLKHHGSYSVKLHPRLSNLRTTDFEAIAHALQKQEFAHIIIDAFYYGSRIENLIYDELAIYLAQKQPDKKIILAHSGGSTILKTMLRTREVPNICYDLSFTINYFLNTSVWMDLFHCIQINPHRMMYGSDYPGFTEGQALEAVQKLFRQFDGSEELYQKLLAENAWRIYFGKENIANG